MNKDLMLLGLVVCYGIVASISISLYNKTAIDKGHIDILKFLFNPYIIVGTAFAFFTRYISYIMLTKYAMNNTVLLSASSYIFVMIASYIFFAEKVTKTQIAGMGFILIGLFIVSYGIE